RRLRQHCRRAARGLLARRSGSADRRLPAGRGLALSRRHRLHIADRLPAVPAQRPLEADAGGEAVSQPQRILAVAVLAVVLAAFSFAAPSLMNDYFVRIITVMCINAILVVSMGLANGFTGVFSLGHMGFVAIGAYVSGVLALSPQAKDSYLPDLPGWIAAINLGYLSSTLVAGLVCVVLAFLVGAPL